MPITWIHGVETIESTSATTSVTEVKTAVIAIVGTAPKGPVNKVTIVNNAKDAAQFGTFAEYGLTSGFTIPYTINAIQAYGTGTIVVVNVFTPSETSETEKTVADETLNFAEGSATLAHPEKVSDFVLTSADDATTYELNTDYTFDAETGAVAKVAGDTLTRIFLSPSITPSRQLPKPPHDVYHATKRRCADEAMAHLPTKNSRGKKTALFC